MQLNLTLDLLKACADQLKNQTRSRRHRRRRQQQQQQHRKWPSTTSSLISSSTLSTATLISSAGIGQGSGSGEHSSDNVTRVQTARSSQALMSPPSPFTLLMRNQNAWDRVLQLGENDETLSNTSATSHDSVVGEEEAFDTRLMGSLTLGSPVIPVSFNPLTRHGEQQPARDEDDTTHVPDTRVPLVIVSPQGTPPRNQRRRQSRQRRRQSELDMMFVLDLDDDPDGSLIATPTRVSDDGLSPATYSRRSRNNTRRRQSSTSLSASLPADSAASINSSPVWTTVSPRSYHVQFHNMLAMDSPLLGPAPSPTPSRSSARIRPPIVRFHRS